MDNFGRSVLLHNYSSAEAQTSHEAAASILRVELGDSPWSGGVAAYKWITWYVLLILNASLYFDTCPSTINFCGCCTPTF